MKSATPYVLGVAGHKGGCGRTTTALALAALWGEQGLRVALVDADSDGAASLVAAGPDGACRWPNVRLVASPREAMQGTFDLVVVDGPSLTALDARAVLLRLQGVVLACPTEIAAIRTLPLATRTLAAAAEAGRLAFLGMVLTRFRNDPFQVRMKAELERLEGDLFLSAPIPEDEGLRSWALTPGSPLPNGPGRGAYALLAEELSMRLDLVGSR